MAIVSADANLAEGNAARQSEIIIDSNASGTQALAMVNALKEKYAASLGNVVEVRSAPISLRAQRPHLRRRDERRRDQCRSDAERSLLQDAESRLVHTRRTREQESRLHIEGALFR